MARIYVAASATKQQEAIKVANKLRELGHEITSRWLAVEGVGYGVDGVTVRRFSGSAEDDLMDVVRADCLVVITGDVETRGGRHSEVGIALAFSKPIFLFGPREQVFHAHKLCTVLGVLGDLPDKIRDVGEYHVRLFNQMRTVGGV